MTDGIGQTRITIGKGQGITQALKAMVEKNKLQLSDGNISKAEWNETVKVLDEIQANRKANNQASIFSKGYLVHENDNIDFTEDEMNMLYKAMGVKLSDKPAQPEQISEKPVEQVAQPSKPQGTIKPEEPEKPVQTVQSSPTELQKDFENDSKKSKLGASIPTADTLKENGFGFHPEPSELDFQGHKHKVDVYGNKDENGLHYLMDKNGGKTYIDKDGNSIRISKFEAQFVAPGGTIVSYSSKDGNFTDEVIYGADGKPIQGSMTVKNENGTTISYGYKYDENGNKVVKNSNSQPPQSSGAQSSKIEGKTEITLS